MKKLRFVTILWAAISLAAHAEDADVCSKLSSDGNNSNFWYVALKYLDLFVYSPFMFFIFVRQN